MKSFCEKKIYHRNHKEAIRDKRAFIFVLKKNIGEIIEPQYDFYNITKLTIKPFVPFIFKKDHLEIKTSALINKNEIHIFANYKIKIIYGETDNSDLIFKNICLKLRPEPVLREFKDNNFYEIKISNEKTKKRDGVFEELIIEKYIFQVWENNKLMVESINV